MKNLLVLHLESISRQRLAAFAPVFVHTSRLLQQSLVFERCYSSATSTLMVMTYLLHANDFEFDACPVFQGMRPAGNNPNLFTLLEERGYGADVLALNGFHVQRPTLLAGLAGQMKPVWSTNDFPTLFARFEALTDGPRPFAIYVWDLLTHVEHSQVLAPLATGLTDQLERACSIADDAVGTLLSILERKGLLDETVIVAYGDHGDDYWTHGYQGGMVHATAPRTDVTWVPLAIRAPSLTPGTSARLASTVDIAPTCLEMLGIDPPFAFPFSGSSLLTHTREIAFSQNFTASQADDTVLGIAQAYAAVDPTHVLIASSRGLALHAHRLDPGNHCNLLHFFALAANGTLTYRPRAVAAPHFRAALQDNPQAIGAIQRDFTKLRTALAERVKAKRTYIAGRGGDAVNTLSPDAFERISPEGADAGRPDRRAGESAPGRIDYTVRIR